MFGAKIFLSFFRNIVASLAISRKRRNSHKHEAAAQPSNPEPVQRMQRNHREKEHGEELSSPQLTHLQEEHQNKYALQRNKQKPTVNGAGSGMGGESEGCAANSQDNVPANQSNKLPVGICISPSEDECNSNNPMTTTCTKERSCQLQNISEARFGDLTFQFPRLNPYLLPTPSVVAHLQLRVPQASRSYTGCSRGVQEVPDYNM
ncbi:hypothetical protein Aperf_G00000082654 [Anoplocephala perfoliata]